MARDPEDRTDLVITLHGDAVSVSAFLQMFQFPISSFRRQVADMQLMSANLILGCQRR